jgi:hypothetical protein
VRAFGTFAHICRPRNEPLNIVVRLSNMRSWHRVIVSIVVFIGLFLVSLPGLVYVAGLAKVHGRPIPADPAQISQVAIAAAWRHCREISPVSVQATNPWLYVGKFIYGDPLRTTPGERAAGRIASLHNSRHPLGSKVWWHISNVALSIWITRHWSGAQIGATLVRDGFCNERLGD